jgi:asparagine synthase (glutamine-hydrolysing)
LLSGFVGILALDGSSIEHRVLDRMTRFLAFRGPNVQEPVYQGPVGMGHATLRETEEASNDQQPASLRHSLYIIADARIDARANLIEELRSKSTAGRSLPDSTPDSQLILHAYDCWRERCVEHLLGDFSFAIWDSMERRLFCARDQLGIKLFYYARVGNLLLFSNTLNCLRLHPSVSGRLNDRAIADFLLFDMNQEASTTSFADIQRLPPAHSLVCTDGAISVRRYWDLSITTPVRYAREQDYIDHFRELLDVAVSDRLRGNSAGMLMSGGLDSTTVAASAKRVYAGRGTAFDLRAYTEVFDTLIPHEERHFASLTANALSIPIEFLTSDNLKLFDRAQTVGNYSPEPKHTAVADTTIDQLRQALPHCRVVLTGYGGDPALSARLSVHFRSVLRNRQFSAAIFDAIRFLGSEGRFSRLYIPTRARIAFAPKQSKPSCPTWLNPDLYRRLGISDRWNTVGYNRVSDYTDAVRPEANNAIMAPMWPWLFEMHDAGVTGIPVEVSHPFFDLRLLSFLLALPRLPLCSDKELFREAGRGTLPNEVRLRRKSPLPASPVIALLQQPDSSWVDRFEPVPELRNYVVRDRIPHVFAEKDSWSAWVNLRPLSLNYWLRTVNDLRQDGSG